jgi:MFS family permease
VRESGNPIPVRVWTGYTFLLLAVVLVIVDYTIADCVVPNLVRDLDLTVDDVGAAMTSYLAVAAAFTIPGGKLADRIGRRRLLLAGLTLYAAGSVLTGLAWSFWPLLAGRVLQGLSLASVLPSGLGLLNSMFPPQRPGRHRALGLWATAIGVAAGLGPLIGGRWPSPSHGAGHFLAVCRWRHSPPRASGWDCPKVKGGRRRALTSRGRLCSHLPRGVSSSWPTGGIIWGPRRL